LHGFDAKSGAGPKVFASKAAPQGKTWPK